MFKASPVFLANFNATKKIVVNQGGTSAGKTYSIIQVLFTRAIYNPNSIITVVGRDIPMLKKGALRDAQKIIRETDELAQYILEYNKTDRIFYFKNGSIMEFSSFEDELDARGGRRDYLYINEINSIPYMLYWQLGIRTSKQIFVDYNPTNRFFIHEKILPLPECQLIISDHRHNPFIPQELHDEIEGITDDELFQVYARGKTGKIKGLIMGHCKQVETFPADCGKIIWGIDYGYTNDPTALVKVGIRGRQRFLKECSYEPGITPQRLKDILVLNGYKDEPIFSEHDPNIISQLRRLNLPVFPARKGPGSVAAGISKIKEYECFYTVDSIHLKAEIESWKWVVAQDLTSGKEVMTNIPIDGNDHACQAAIYAIYTDSFRQSA